MKKFLALCLVLFGMASFCRADSFSEYLANKEVFIKGRVSVAANVSTNSILISLSSTTGVYPWPHGNVDPNATREVNIDYIRLDIDKTAASTCTVKVGVITYVDSSSANITYVWGRESSKNVSNTNVLDTQMFFPSALRCRVNPNGSSEGYTPYILSNNTNNYTTLVSNVGIPSILDVNGPKANFTVFPRVGDIILSVTNGTVAIIVNIEMFYRTGAF